MTGKGRSKGPTVNNILTCWSGDTLVHGIHSEKTDLTKCNLLGMRGLPKLPFWKLRVFLTGSDDTRFFSTNEGLVPKKLWINPGKFQEEFR